jgi:secreted PhoX family phosphatase
MKTEADPEGRTVLGTLNNCGSGLTPWGTYLSAEENWALYFDGREERDADQRRWGLLRTGLSRWGEHDPRFDASRHPNEFHRFGWIVEIDPYDPASVPVKRTALGRGAKEGAWVATTRDGRAVVYSGEDARFEYIYKFVSRDRIAPGGAKANATLLDHGTLYVARFDGDGTGRWLPLVQGQGPLTADNGFPDQGAVVIRSRQASDVLGATKMDRPEWIAIDPNARTVYCTLTNNSRRGRPDHPAVDAANPRANNTMGHIIQWTEDGDFGATTFRWKHLLLAGDPANQRPEARGNIRGDRFACPDGLTLDARGVLWIQTDIASDEMYRGEMQRLGNNQMLACDPATGEVRRFLTGPVGCEITGIALTPDGCTMFVNIQHPGEPLTPRDDGLEVPNLHSDPADPRRYSNWPDFLADGRPRSATVAIRKTDGGPIGT